MKNFAKPNLGALFPAITLPKFTGGTLNLGNTVQTADEWQLLVVYRGKHCPLCTSYLRHLNRVAATLSQLGVRVVAVSADSKERVAEQMVDVSPTYDVGYGLTVDQMTQMGLWVSSPKNGMDAERLFAEPGLFVTDAAGLLRMVDISNVPFMRPDLESVQRGIQFLRPRATDFPINGTFA